MGIPQRPDLPPDPNLVAASDTGAATALRRVPWSAWIWVALAVLVAGAGSVTILRASEGPGSSTPPFATLLTAAVLVSAVLSLALAIVIRLVGLPGRIAAAAAGAFASIAVAKFALGPAAFLERNQVEAISIQIGLDTLVVLLNAGIVMALYLVAVSAIYIFAGGRIAPAKSDGLRTPIGLAVAMLAGAGVIVWIGGGGAYLEFLLSSASIGAIAAALVLAAGLMTVAFRSTANAVRATGRVGVYFTLFWVAVVFLILFHVLWVVYMLVLISIWPLRTVVPK